MRVAAWLRAWGLRIRRETRRQQDTKQRLFRAAPSGRVPGRGVCSEVEPPRRQGRQAEVDGLRPAGRVPVGVCARRLNRQDAKDAKQRWMGFARRGAVQTGHMGDRSAKRPTDNRPAGHTPDRRSRAASLLRGLPVFVSPFCLASLAPWRLIPRAHAPTGTRPDGHTPRRAHARRAHARRAHAPPPGTRPIGAARNNLCFVAFLSSCLPLCLACLAPWRFTLGAHVPPPTQPPKRENAGTLASTGVTAETSSRTSGADRLAHSPDRSGPSCCGSSGSCRSGRRSRCHGCRSS